MPVERKPIQLRIPEDLAQQISEEAELAGRSVNNLIERILRDSIDHKRKVRHEATYGMEVIDVTNDPEELPTDDYKRARGAISPTPGSPPAEQVIRNIRDGETPLLGRAARFLPDSSTSM